MEAAAQAQIQSTPSRKLQLYIYGSCECYQYYHPNRDSESKRPICLTDIDNFKIQNEDEPEQQAQIIPNPLLREEILKIACGALHTVVATTEGSVYTFGCNDEGALGRQGFETIPIKVALDDPIDLISAGDNHSIFANSVIGSIYFTGNYKYLRGESMADKIRTPIRYDIGQFDARLKNQPIQKVVSGSNHSAVLAGGKIFIRGEPQAHTVGRRINARHKVEASLSFDGLGLTKVQDLWCGGYHNIAKVKKGKTWQYFVWGLNQHGQLGLRNYDDVEYPTELERFRGVNIIEVATGTNFTIVLTEDGQLFGCGQNDDGQLGLGDNYIYEDSEQQQEEQVEEKVVVEKKKSQKKAKKGKKNSKKTNDNEEKEKKKEGGEQKQQELQEKKKENQQDKKQEIKEKNDGKEKEGNQNQVENKLDHNAQQNDIEKKEHIPENKPQEHNQRKEEIPIEIENKPVELAPQVEDEPKIQPAVQEQKQPEPEAAVEKKMEVQNPAQEPKTNKQENIYIKSFKKINVDQKITKITSGSEFSFAWNDQSLYSWGFGSSFVLLNGQEDDQTVPFKVKPKILKEQAIYDLAAGAQHVAYLSYPTSDEKPTPKLSQKALQNSVLVKKALSKRKKA